MKVPKHIEEKMRKVVQLHQTAKEKMNDIERWLEEKGLDTSEYGLRDGSGVSLDELDYGIDIVDELCVRIALELEGKDWLSAMKERE